MKFHAVYRPINASPDDTRNQDSQISADSWMHALSLAINKREPGYELRLLMLDIGAFDKISAVQNQQFRN